MSPHNLVPLMACLLNVSLAAVSVLRNPGSRLNRVFSYFAAGMALWNFGVWGLRSSPDEPTAVFWEVVIHVGVILLPAFYYHFVLIFLDATTRHRPSLALAYLTALFLGVLNVTGSPLFITGVKATYWGWAPATGPFYNLFLLYLNAFLIWGLVHLMRTYKGVESSFRRNRAMLILLGTSVSLAGGMIDFARFIVARFWPAAEHIYPVGIPANMIFALMLGTSIVRYRLFDVNVFVKKAAVYTVVASAVTVAMGVLIWGIEHYYDLRAISAVWAIVPITFPLASALSVTIRISMELTSLRLKTVSAKSISFPVETRTAASKISRRLLETALSPSLTLVTLQPAPARQSSTSSQHSEQTSRVLSNRRGNVTTKTKGSLAGRSNRRASNGNGWTAGGKCVFYRRNVLRIRLIKKIDPCA